MARLKASPLFLLLACGALLGLSSCGGGSGADLLPGTTAKQINANLDQVRGYVAEGDCVSAEDAVAAVIDEVDGLGGVDAKLKAALKEGATRLSEVVASCESEEDEEEEEPEPTVEPAVEARELEAEEKREEKRLEREEQAEERSEAEHGGPGQGEHGPGHGEGPTLPPQANGKGEEKGGGNSNPPPAAESGPSGGIGPGVRAGGD
jgi:hypothetical protein